MKPFGKLYRKSTIKALSALTAVAWVTGPAAAGVPQRDIVITKCPQGTFAADWQGVAGRTYFLLWSTDLLGWSYAPFMDFGDGMHSRGLASSSPKGFVRLFTVDDEATTNLEEAMNADFDNDGLSNIYEVMYGFDPYEADGYGAGDADEDGSLTVHEAAAGRNPQVKDHPAVKLAVVVLN